MPQRKDYTGKRFGRLVALEYVGSYQYRCQCDCGNTAVVRSINLTSNHTTSCGCRKLEHALKNCARINADPDRPNNLAAFTATVQQDPSLHPLYKDGRCGTPEYEAYRGAVARCTDSSRPDWLDYGGRGIEFRFTSFEQFFQEVGLRPPGKAGKFALYSIDRINNDGHYEPGNVRWATRSQQNANRKRKP